uniref:Uncharacterized protein n=1 Tax=Arundo donax TaxID=35708 RepID=A0A0A9D880_ARUDO
MIDSIQGTSCAERDLWFKQLIASYVPII